MNRIDYLTRTSKEIGRVVENMQNDGWSREEALHIVDIAAQVRLSDEIGWVRSALQKEERK